MARRLVEVRRGEYLTTRGLAEKAGVSPRTVWRIETGKHGELHLSTMKKIADALGVHPSEITEFLPKGKEEQEP